MYQPAYPPTAAIEQMIQTLRLEIDGLKSTVEFLSGISERSTETGADQHDRLARIEDFQRMLMEKVRELGENQKIIGQWLSTFQQPMVQITPPVPEPIPATLPDIETQ